MVTLILDAHLSPALALWLNQTYTSIAAISARSIGMLYADDLTFYKEARERNAILVSKDRDFVALSQRLGFPPMVVYLKSGNTSTQALRTLFAEHIESILLFYAEGSGLIEIK